MKTKSRLIQNVDYQAVAEGNGTLTLDLGRTGVYHYVDVPRDVWLDLLAAESMGKFFNVHIRSNYTFLKD